MIELTADIDIEEIKKRLGDFDGNVEEAFEGIFDLWTERIHAKVAKNSKRTGGLIGRRTGALVRAAGLRKYTLKKVAAGFEATLSGLPPYARIQEKGGTIKAKGDGWLTVPLPPAQTPAGVTRPEAIRLKRKDNKASVLFKSKKGNLIIAKKQGNDLTPYWVLKREVDISATHWFSQSVEESLGSLELLMVDDIEGAFKV